MNTENDYLVHYGVKGMRWGVRRQAKNDAKEYARAKMYYGKGAGTRRKLIKAKVEERSKDPDYKKEFDKYLSAQNMSKHADKARQERARKDFTETTIKTGKGILRLALETGGKVSLAAAAAYTLARYTGVDEVVKQYLNRKLSKLKMG